MPSRVFAYMLAADTDSHTAAELAAGLRVSPAAISGAVRYLQQVGMVERRREPGARVDHYELREDLWYELYGGRLQAMEAWESVLAETASHVDPGSPAAARLREATAFVAFLRADLPELMERWKRYWAAEQADQGRRPS
jgi:DNA-binding transcriptional regulator GbsR (MarR family)